MYPYSYDILVNKDHPLCGEIPPSCLTFSEIPFMAPPEDPKRQLEKVTAKAASKLFFSASAEGLSLYGISGYRSFCRQAELYENASDPAQIAPPGTSEHHTGLALDVSCPECDFQLTEAFAKTSEGKWISRNAPLYGFILRYPAEKGKITGYPWEPWHIRYVTRSLALYLTLTGLTLEEYHAQASTAPSAVP